MAELTSNGEFLSDEEILRRLETSDNPDALKDTILALVVSEYAKRTANDSNLPVKLREGAVAAEKRAWEVVATGCALSPDYESVSLKTAQLVAKSRSGATKFRAKNQEYLDRICGMSGSRRANW